MNFLVFPSRISFGKLGSIVTCPECRTLDGGTCGGTLLVTFAAVASILRLPIAKLRNGAAARVRFVWSGGEQTSAQGQRARPRECRPDATM